MGICGSAKKAPSKKRYDGEMAISNEANFITNEQKNNNNNNNLNFQSQNQVQVEFNNNK